MAQSLPAYRPLNPTLASRSALGFEPLTDSEPGWHGAIRLDYGNVLEAVTRTSADYLLDAELVRLNFSLSRRLGRWELQGSLPIESAESGALDPFITWWHNLFGFHEERRAERPYNQYDYFIQFPDSSRITPPLGRTALGDLRLGVGFYHSRNWRSALLIALPTNSRPDGWGLQTVAVGVTTTGQAPIVRERLVWEGSAGVGYTSKAGELAQWQREFFASASSGVRFKFWGQQSAYTNFLFHSGGWYNTTLPALDRPDFSLDFGFLLKPGSDGPEILAGIVEDLYPFGPAVDLVFRLGVRW